MALGSATNKQLISLSTYVLRTHRPLRPLITLHPERATQVPLPSLLRSRSYAGSTPSGSVKTPSRKQVTVRNDDGRIQWGDLTVGEKAARTTQQTFNFGVILLGLGMTVRQHSILGCSLLMQLRLEWSTFYILKSSLRTAKPDILIVLSTRSEPILAH